MSILLRFLYAVLAFLIVSFVCGLVPVLAPYAFVVAIIIALIVFLGADRL